MFASPSERTSKHPRDRHTKKRRRDIRAVVDVLVQRPSLTRWSFATSHQTDRVNVEQKRRSTTFDICFRVEHVRLPERKLKRMQSRRILVEQIAQISRRLMSCVDS